MRIKTDLEWQIAANRGFAEKLLRAKNFQEAFRIQVEHFQSQLKVVAEDASKFGTQSLKPPTASLRVGASSA
jgi:hypothetical protein